MPGLLDAIGQQRQVWKQKREIKALQSELEKLRGENERTRNAMRRCLTCDYRVKALGGREEPAAGAAEERG